ncbi:MAG: hypothetical protein IKA00_13185 [Prevotella sp.]|nr:hypothetical protein [Prevotella sp.]
MKKLLLSVLAVLGVMSVNAYEVNDYIYTPSAKFKVIGANQVTNGNFAEATTGWQGLDGAEVSALAWQYTPAAGPNGENVLTSMGSAEGNVLARMMELNPGTYSVSYWIKGAEAGGSTLNVPGANYTGVYVNTDASLTTVGRNVADIGAYSMEWMQVNDTVQIAQGEYLVIYFDQMATGVMVTNFEVNEIAQVYDTRIIERELAFIKPLMENTELFPNQGELPDVVGAIEAALAGDTSFGIDFSDPGAIAGVEDFLAQNYYPNKDAFMTNNSGNQLAFISYGDIAGWPKFNNGDGKKSQGDWKFSGTTMRWGHKQDAANGNYAYPGNYDLLDGTAMIEKADMKPGKYLFSLEVQAIKYFKTKINNNYYHPDYTTNMLGGKLFFGKDTVVIDTISNRNYDRVTIISELAEGDTLRAGFYFPGFPVGTGGGEGLFKGAMLRIIGHSDADLALEELVKNIASAQNALKVMIDSAKTVTAKNEEYPWGMDALIAAIPAFEDYLNSTYAIVDANGNNLVLTTDLTDEQNNIPTEINDQMAAMRTAIQNLYALNQPIYDIKDAIAYHRENILLEKYAAAVASTRAAYEGSIAAAEALLATVAKLDSIPAADEHAKFVAAIDDMVAKQKDFELSCASYAAPADLQIKNGDFVNGGKRSKTGNVNDWNLIKGTNYKEHTWPDLTADAGYEAYGVQTWRGYTAPPQFKMQQVSTVSLPGVYEFRVLGQGHSENNKYRGYYTIISDEETGTAVDTTFEKSELYYFMGANGAPDSTIFHSQYSDNLYKVSWFSVCHIKESADAEEFEYGMEGNRTLVSGQGPNTYMMGAARLFYCGDATKYDADITADLANYVGQANAMLALPEAQAEANKWMAIKLQRYVNDAAAATTLTQKMNTIHRLKETMDRLNILVSGIEGVEAETVLDANAKGVYSITGVKLGNELKGLQKGLYIINGKKYIVK